MRDDNKTSKLVELEKLAKILKDRCFEKIEDCIFPANYEIRGLEVFDLLGQHFLSYGDKSGVLQVYNLENMTTRDLVLEENLEGIINILSFKEMPGNHGLLFVGVRFKGMYVYHFSVENGNVTHKKMSPVFEEKKFISFFFPNIFFDKNDKLARFEVWICFDDGDFRIYTGGFPGKQWKLKEKRPLNSDKGPGEFLKYKTDEDAEKELTNRLLYCIFSGSTPVKIQWCRVVAAHVKEKSPWYTENKKKILDCLNLFKMEKNLELLREFLDLARLFTIEEVKEPIDYLKDNAPYAEIRRAAGRFAPLSSK